MNRLAATLSLAAAPAVLAWAAPAVLATADPGAQDPATDPTVYMIASCYTLGDPLDQRPQQVLYNCDGSATMTDMTWSAWGAEGAIGHGIDKAVECKPNCAQGPLKVNPIEVRAWNPRPAADPACPAGVQFYSDLTIAYPEGVPPWIVPGTTWDDGVDFVTIDGMPGVHWSNQKPLSCQPPAA